MQVMHISRREQLRQKDCGEEQTTAATKLIRPGDATRIPLQVQGIVEDARFSDINQLDELSMAFQPGSDKTSFHFGVRDFDTGNSGRTRLPG